jgi:hypothetical protein
VAPLAADDAYRAARKRALHLVGLDEVAFRSRLGQWLARRGFDWETITSVVDRLWTELGMPDVSTSSSTARAPTA